tara:strand:- start:63 stop:803 length:741 start_codon:yes stop_codon:yes gene_type:complete
MNLKGIGDYTSSAIASIAFKKKHYVIDGNVKRIMARFLCLKNFSKTSFNKIHKFLSNHIDSNEPGDFNQGLMDLGRDICKPKKPLCTICPIADQCQAYSIKAIDSYPVIKQKNTKLPHYVIGVGVIWHKNKMLITKRKKNALLGGLWEFPGGKVIKNESIPECIKREVLEELSIDVEVQNFIITINHKYSHFSITLHAHHCVYKKGKVKCNVADDWKWIDPNQLVDFPFPKANHYIFPHLLNKGVA